MNRSAGIARFVLTVACVVGLSQGTRAADAPPTIYTANPIVLHDDAQKKDLAIRVTAPAKGTALPLILFAHGAQYSKDDYLPLPEFWAEHGYAVIQPTFIESLSLGLPRNDPQVQDAWRSRILDMHKVLDSLNEIEGDIPWLKGRIDRKKIVTAGHSFGGHTAAALVGAKVMQPETDLTDPRVSAGILMAPPPLAPGFRMVEWKSSSKPVLVIVGQADVQPGFADKWEDHADYYMKTNVGNRCLAVMAGVQHYLGGILGTHRTEDMTPNPETVETIKAMTLAFLDTQVHGSKAWPQLVEKYKSAKPATISQFECK